MKMFEGNIVECIRCGDELEVNRKNFWFYPSVNRFKMPCKKCQAERQRQELKERNEKRNEKYKTDFHYRAKEDKRQSSFGYRLVRNQRRRNETKILADSYVRQVLKDTHKIKNAMPEMIELKRLQIQLHRITHGST